MPVPVAVAAKVELTLEFSLNTQIEVDTTVTFVLLKFENKLDIVYQSLKFVIMGTVKM